MPFSDHDRTNPYRILSLDGGDETTLISLQMLRRIERDVPFLGNIHLFTGVGGSALNAIILSVAADDLKLKALDDLIEFWLESVIKEESLENMIRGLSGAGPFFPNTQLRHALHGLLKKYDLDDLSWQDFCNLETSGHILVPTLQLKGKSQDLQKLFRKSIFSDSQGKDDALKTTALKHHWQPKYFHNYENLTKDPNAFGDISVLDVLLRAMSAPIIYPVYQEFLDATLFLSNPSVCGIRFGLEHLEHRCQANYQSHIEEHKELQGLIVALLHQHQDFFHQVKRRIKDQEGMIKQYVEGNIRDPHKDYVAHFENLINQILPKDQCDQKIKEQDLWPREKMNNYAEYVLDEMILTFTNYVFHTDIKDFSFLRNREFTSKYEAFRNLASMVGFFPPKNKMPYIQMLSVGTGIGANSLNVPNPMAGWQFWFNNHQQTMPLNAAIQGCQAIFYDETSEIILGRNYHRLDTYYNHGSYTLNSYESKLEMMRIATNANVDRTKQWIDVEGWCGTKEPSLVTSFLFDFLSVL